MLQCATRNRAGRLLSAAAAGILAQKFVARTRRSRSRTRPNKANWELAEKFSGHRPACVRASTTSAVNPRVGSGRCDSLWATTGGITTGNGDLPLLVVPTTKTEAAALFDQVKLTAQLSDLSHHARDRSRTCQFNLDLPQRRRSPRIEVVYRSPPDSFLKWDVDESPLKALKRLGVPADARRRVQLAVVAAAVGVAVAAE